MRATDLEHMGAALDAARRALAAGEVPIGACLVADGRVQAGHNRVVSQADPTAHAEMELIRAASASRRGALPPDTCLYVTVEPCAMCLGACHYAGIARIVFGASLDDLQEITGTECSLRSGQQPAMQSGCRRDESLELLHAWAARGARRS